MNCRGKIAAVIYSTGASSIYISNNTRILQAFSSQGTILQFLSTNEVEISNTQFKDNLQENIYFESAVLRIANSSFENSGKEFLNGKNADLYLQSVVMKDNQNTQLEGMGVYCNCHTLQVQNSTFQNLSALKGGAFYLQSFKDSQFTFDQNKFFNNSASRGGAIFIEKAQNITFTNNNFTQNKAEKPSDSNSLDQIIGGAIYFQCLTTQNLSCNVSLLQKNTFLKNSAQNQGGALSYSNILFKTDNSNQFIENSAPYGNDQSSFAKTLVFEMITNNDYLNSSLYSPSKRILRRRLALSSSHLTENPITVVSGRSFSFRLTLYDQENNLMSQENTATATIKVVDQNGVSSIVLSNNEAKASNGVFYFRDVLLIAPPGSQIGFQLAVSSLETYGNSIPFIDDPLNIEIDTRFCAPGEEYTSDFRCVVCPPGLYLYQAPNTSTSCKDCSPYAICYSGSSVAPIEGYWRKSNTSELFVKCPRKESCLEGDRDNPSGKCAVGYQGEVCGICQSGFSKVSNFECSKCPSVIENTIKLAFIFLGVILIIVFLVRSTLQSADKQKPVYSVYLKIIANHFQIIGTLSSIDFSWPSEIQRLEDSQQSVSSVSEQVFSFDCFLMGNDQQQGQDGQIYYMKLIFFAFLPAILSFGATVYWLLHSAIKRNFSELKNSLISTIVIVLFLVHPNIAKAMFSSFNCTSIDNELRLMPDISQICFQGKHAVYLYTVSAPSVILWAFGIPLFALILLLKNKKIILQIESQQIQSKSDKWTIKRIKTQLGFLFNGYKIKSFYWEIVILYRKILLIMVTVFLSSVSPETQVLVGLIIIIISILLQIRIRPYYTSTLNRMESYSLMVSAVTLYSGMFYITGRNYSYMSNDGVKWFFLVCIAFPNVVFFAYWLYNMVIEILKLLLQNNQAKLFRFLTCGKVNLDKFERKHLKTVRSGFDDEEIDDNLDPDQANPDAPGLKYIVNENSDPLNKILGLSRSPRQKLLSENVSTRRDITEQMNYSDLPTATQRGPRDRQISDSNSKLVHDNSTTILDVSGNEDFYNISQSFRNNRSILKKSEKHSPNQKTQQRKRLPFGNDAIDIEDIKVEEEKDFKSQKKQRIVFNLNLEEKLKTLNAGQQIMLDNYQAELAQTFSAPGKFQEYKIPVENQLIQDLSQKQDFTFEKSESAQSQPQNQCNDEQELNNGDLFQNNKRNRIKQDNRLQVQTQRNNDPTDLQFSHRGKNSLNQNGILSFRSNHKVFPLDQLLKLKDNILTHRPQSSLMEMKDEETIRRTQLKSVKSGAQTERKLKKKENQSSLKADIIIQNAQNSHNFENSQGEIFVPIHSSDSKKDTQNQVNDPTYNPFNQGLPQKLNDQAPKQSREERKKQIKHQKKKQNRRNRLNAYDHSRERYPFEHPQNLVNDNDLASGTKQEYSINLQAKQSQQEKNTEIFYSRRNTLNQIKTVDLKMRTEKSLDKLSSTEYLPQINQQEFYETNEVKDINKTVSSIEARNQNMNQSAMNNRISNYESGWESKQNSKNVDNYLIQGQDLQQYSQFTKLTQLQIFNNFFEDIKEQRNGFSSPEKQKTAQNQDQNQNNQNASEVGKLNFYPDQLQSNRAENKNSDDDWEVEDKSLHRNHKAIVEEKNKSRNLFQNKRANKRNKEYSNLQEIGQNNANFALESNLEDIENFNKQAKKNIFSSKRKDQFLEDNTQFNKQQLFQNPLL